MSSRPGDLAVLVVALVVVTLRDAVVSGIDSLAVRAAVIGPAAMRKVRRKDQKLACIKCQTQSFLER